MRAARRWVTDLRFDAGYAQGIFKMTANAAKSRKAHEIPCGSGRRLPCRGKVVIDTTVGLAGLHGPKILDAMCHIHRYRTTKGTPVEPSFVSRFVVALAWEKPFDHPVD
ncbi:IQ calmodulin-binding motif-containing protein [Burkholderia lata]|nr:IQ calmodulin-binding motif-containing protein [Burkholderia lata]